MKSLKVKIEGNTPIIMHNCILADPLDERSVEMKKLSSKRNKTIDDHKQMSKLEFESALYLTGKKGDENRRVKITKECILACIIEGGKVTKIGTDLKSAVRIAKDVVLKYKGPKNWEELFTYGNGKFVDRRAVVVSRNRIFRTRPIFYPWRLEFEILYHEDMMDKGQILNAIDNAGARKGLLDYRPFFGRFDRVDKFDDDSKNWTKESYDE